MTVDSPRTSGVGLLAAGLAIAACCAGRFARGQDEPPSGPPAAAESARELSERLRRLEEMNRRLLDRVDELSEENKTLSKKYSDLTKKVEKAAEKEEEKESEGYEVTEAEASGYEGREGTRGPSETGRAGGARLIPSAQGVGNRGLGKIPTRTFLDYAHDGFGFETDDSEYQLKFRSELQVDSLIYLNPIGQHPVSSGSYLPRTRYYFQGRMTKPIEYQLSFQRSYTTFGFLNVFLNFNYDRRFQLRVGRYKVPFTYEWYKVNNWRLITPERSLYNLNFGLSRMVGLMGWGELFDDHLEYAVGVFDGPRNSFQDYNGAKDVIALLNYRPFHGSESPLRNLNVGGSVDSGIQDNPLNPAVLRTNANASSVDLASTDPINNATVPFLAFNQDVRERGLRTLWDLHLAYFYKGLSLIAEWGSGFESFARGHDARPTRVPIEGYSVAVSYLITGETVNERTLVDPIRRFDLRRGKFGPGAIEPFARFSALDLSDRVFTGGLADPNLWTNHARIVDVGTNWYLNRHVKIYFDWQRAMFGSAVYDRPGGLSRSNDLFWLRFQLYF